MVKIWLSSKQYEVWGWGSFWGWIPHGIIDSEPQVADDISKSLTPCITTNLDDHDFKSAVNQSKLLDIPKRWLDGDDSVDMADVIGGESIEVLGHCWR